ncbi:MAG: sigma-70 family RNA polymerase sigma factor [Planctomycetota bacterium]|nr:MAG: sigma-70 family RNA polymerase sigma factor [Planctomycetota bacterium]
MTASARSNASSPTCDVADLSQVTDEELLARFVADGDRVSFEALVRRYRHELYNYLRRYLGDECLAEDAFQLTFVRVFQRAEQFDPDRRFRPWLYSVATNQAIDLRRRNKNRTHHSLDVALQGTDGRTVSHAAALEDHRQSHEDPLVQAEFRDQMRAAVAEIGEPGRSALELVYLQGLPYKDAAEILNVPVGTVKSRVHAAIRKLAVVWKRTKR